MKLLLSLFFSLSFSAAYAGFSEARDALDQGDHKTAIFNFKEAISEEEDEDFKSDIYLLLGMTYTAAGDDIDNDHKLAFDAYTKATNNYNKTLYSLLGNSYFYGQGTDKNDKLAIQYYELGLKHEEQEHVLWMLGKIYLHGYGTQQDYTKALAYFLRADALNDSNSRFELGHLYEYGKGVDKNIDKALDYYRLAAKEGDADAQYKIDLLTGTLSASERNTNFETALDYTYGYTREVNNQQAIKYYQLAADEGSVVSEYNIGYLLETTMPTKQYSQAAQYFIKSAEAGNIYAQTVLASNYLLGIGVKVDKKKSAYWEAKAAEQGNLSSIKETANNYYLGIGVDKNYKTAFKWHQQAVDLGDKESIYKLAKMFDAGEGTDKDQDKAIELYTKAAEAGYAEAQNKLAQIYFKGIKGVKKDYKTSFKWATKAADQGLADAQNKMGIFYSTGKHVVEINMQTAFEWFQKAADQGSTKAFINLGAFYAAGQGVKLDSNKAYKWYKKAAEAGDKQGQYHIGRHYDFGISVQKDINEAVKWYKKSANQDFRKAQTALGTVHYYGDEEAGFPINYKKAANWYYKAATNDKIESEEERQVDVIVTSSGSGFFVTPNHIITNNHVTEGCDEIQVKNKGYKATVELLDTDATTDLSILVTGKPSKYFLHLRNRKPVSTGEQSLALGYPFSTALGSELKVTSGNIAALTGFNNNIAELQLTAPVQPGNSGGPLLDDNGNVIGVIVSRLETSSEITDDRPAQNVNFAIKSNMAKIFMDLNMIDYQVRKANGSMSVSQIVTEAKEATVQVICKEK